MNYYRNRKKGGIFRRRGHSLAGKHMVSGTVQYLGAEKGFLKIAGKRILFRDSESGESEICAGIHEI